MDAVICDVDASRMSVSEAAPIAARCARDRIALPWSGAFRHIRHPLRAKDSEHRPRVVSGSSGTAALRVWPPGNDAGPVLGILGP